MSESTQVQFPRFQYETPQDGPINKRQLINRTQPRPWLSVPELITLCSPKANTNTRKTSGYTSVRGDWYGLSHVQREAITPGQIVDLPFDEGNGVLYRSRLLDHQFLWDRQSVQGRRQEIVLEKLDIARGGFKELLAIMIEGKGVAPHEPLPENQQLVMATDMGRWFEPEFGDNNTKTSYYLNVLQQLALRETVAVEVITVNS